MYFNYIKIKNIEIYMLNKLNFFKKDDNFINIFLAII